MWYDPEMDLGTGEQLSFGLWADDVGRELDVLPTREEALGYVLAGAYDPPPGVRYELDAWVLVSSVTVV